MFLTLALVTAISFCLIKLGAASVWIGLLSLALKTVMLAVLAVALYFGLPLLWRRFKG